MKIKELLEKTTNEFIYPCTPATQEDIDFIVTPILDTIKDWLTQKQDEQQKILCEDHNWWEYPDANKKIQFFKELLEELEK